MLLGLFRAIYQNGLVCGDTFGEVRMPHKDNIVDKVIEGAYEVLETFDEVAEKCEQMQSLQLSPPTLQALVYAAITYLFGDDHQSVTEE